MFFAWLLALFCLAGIVSYSIVTSTPASPIPSAFSSYEAKNVDSSNLLWSSVLDGGPPLEANLTPLGPQHKLYDWQEREISVWQGIYNTKRQAGFTGLVDKDAAKELIQPCYSFQCHYQQQTQRVGSVQLFSSATFGAVVIAVTQSDDFNGSRWMERPELANYDLIVVHSGSGPYETKKKDSQQLHCPMCRAIIRASPNNEEVSKWKLVHDFVMSPDWSELVRVCKYRYVMLPDEDRNLMDQCSITKVFTTMAAFDLMLASPSLCRSPGVFAKSHAPYQNFSTVLRYINTLQPPLHAPVFQIQFFQDAVRHSLFAASLHTGYGIGLERVWSGLLGHDVKSTALIDSGCMIPSFTAVEVAPEKLSSFEKRHLEREQAKLFTAFDKLSNIVITTNSSISGPRDDRSELEVLGAVSWQDLYKSVGDFTEYAGLLRRCKAESSRPMNSPFLASDTAAAESKSPEQRHSSEMKRFGGSFRSKIVPSRRKGTKNSVTH